MVMSTIFNHDGDDISDQNIPFLLDQSEEFHWLFGDKNWFLLPDKAVDAFKLFTNFDFKTLTVPEKDWLSSPTNQRDKNSDNGRLIVHRSTVIHPGTVIFGDAIIGANCEIGPNTVLFGPLIMVANNYFGPGSEVRRSIIMAGAKAPHQSYVGHSIVGRNVTMAAGFTTSVKNLKQSTVYYWGKKGLTDSGMRHFGALLADNLEFGCNVLVMPGRTVISNHFIPPGTIILKQYTNAVFVGDCDLASRCQIP
jgi:NDP-sugar pyrophosphorylase family protein